jgi:hypothetical protein
MSSLSRKRVLSSCMRGDGVLVEVLRRARALARLSSVWFVAAIHCYRITSGAVARCS